jgi:hypothetical protein
MSNPTDDEGFKKEAAKPPLRRSTRVESKTSNKRSRIDDDMTGNEGSTQTDGSRRNSKRLKASSNYRDSHGDGVNQDDDDMNQHDEALVEYTTADLSNLVVAQKSRAKACWEKQRESVSPAVHERVLEQLDNGEVPSIFHAFCIERDRRLYSPQTAFVCEKMIPKERAIAIWGSQDNDVLGLQDNDVLEQLRNGDVPFNFHNLSIRFHNRLFLPEMNFGDGLEIQMDRAIALWNSWFTEKNLLTQEEFNRILEQLERGEFPHSFQTLYEEHKEMIPMKIPIPIQLSAEAVQVGVAENTEKGNIPPEQEDSYIKGFFCDRIHNARVTVEDSRVSTTPWTFNPKYTNLVTELVNASAKMVGHDVEVTQLTTPFAIDKVSGLNLITRSLSRGVVAACFYKSSSFTSHAITGNPGIGKSWTLIYALQQALLYENACVLFCFQKYSAALVCIRKNNHIYVWRNNDPSFKRQQRIGIVRSSRQWSPIR